MSAPLDAVSFLTRIRVPSSGSVRGIAPWIVVVGAVIGGVNAGVYVGLAQVLPRVAAAAIALAFGMLLTGALHEDGLADVADGFGGGVDRARTLEIMKDPRLGTYGVAALTLGLIVRIAAMASMSSKTALLALPLAHVVSRSASIVVLGSMQPATRTGSGASFLQQIRPLDLVASGTVGTLIAAALTGGWAAVVVTCAVGTTAAMGWLSKRKIGGITGDVFGAAQQLAEISTLLVATAVGPSIVARWIA